jgi:sugar lactone lactonase YvrE
MTGTKRIAAIGRILQLDLTNDRLSVKSAKTLFKGLVFVSGMAFDQELDRLYWASPAGGYVMTAIPGKDPLPTTLYRFPPVIDNPEHPDAGPVGIAYSPSDQSLYWTLQANCNCVQRARADGSTSPETLFRTTEFAFGIAVGGP